MNFFDSSIYYYISSFQQEWITVVMKIITNFAHAFTLVSIAILIMIFVKNKKMKRDVTLNLIIVFILNQIFKVIIARPRPITNINSVIESSGYSFPSAHAMVSFAFYGFLIYLIHQYIKSKKIKISLTIFLGLLIIGIGISRIYFGVHYATDVIGGFVISAIYLYAFIKYIHKKEPMGRGNWFRKRNVFMKETKWTQNQLKAIQESGTNMLVAAAAGSGKTAVLVERIINKILNKNIDIDKLLVVTFTNAAASEMRQRVLAAIYQKLEEDPNNEKLHRQLMLLNKSNISTIHSFCLDVIRNNFFETNMSANFRIGDNTEINLLKWEAIEEIFDDLYEKEDEDFQLLIDTYTTYKSDDLLKEMVLEIYQNIRE